MGGGEWEEVMVITIGVVGATLLENGWMKTRLRDSEEAKILLDKLIIVESKLENPFWSIP